MRDFKFSDKISEINNDSKKLKNLNSGSNENNEKEMININKNSDLDKHQNINNNQEKTTINHEIFINEKVKNNEIKENKLSEDERDRKIEKILRENKKKN